MEAKAVARTIRIAPRKVRLVLDLIRGKSAGEAIAILKFRPRAQGRASAINKRTSHITIVVSDGKEEAKEA